MSRRGERAVVAELLCSYPAPLELDFRASAGQGMGRVDRPVDPGVAGDDVAAAVPVPALAAVWCCSVGATWTVELHEFDRGAALGTIADWISSGVPISEPQPKTALAHELLTERGFQLFPNSSAGPSCPHRHGIGYACRDADLIEAGTRGSRPGPGPVLLATARPRIRPALPRAGGIPGRARRDR
ncbi:MAG: hypothetical protein ACRDS1_04050 [Pseudonocardiaceae bacterium]